jgi:hypothetical protein
VKTGSVDAALAEESEIVSTRAGGKPFLTQPLTDVADPFVLAVDGSYYLYHTGHGIGVPLYRSHDLVS